MKKKIAIILAALLSVGVLASCGDKKVGKKEVVKEVKELKMVVPDGLPSMSVAKLIKEKPEVDKSYKINYTIEKTPETLVTSVLKGEHDIAIVPSNVAATAYNKGGKYKIVATTGFGSFYLVATNDEVRELKDVKGKTVANIGRGLTPDIITKTIFKERGIDVEKDIKFDYLNAVTELVPALLSGKQSLAVLPEPALSTALAKNPKVKVIANLNDEWKNINKSEFGFPQATVIVKTDVIEKDKEFLNKFLSNVKDSIAWGYENKTKLGEYCEEVGISVKKEVVDKAMERSNIKYADIKDTKNEYINYFKKLNDFDNKTIGGKIPDEGIFMEK